VLLVRPEQPPGQRWIWRNRSGAPGLTPLCSAEVSSDLLDCAVARRLRPIFVAEKAGTAGASGSCQGGAMSRDDRRSHSRIRLELPARVGDGVVETPASSVDLSDGGVLLKSDWTWPLGTELTIRLAVGEARSVAARAVVQRADGERMGLCLGLRGPAFRRLVASLTSESLTA
jgi:hypothetical protein